MLETISSALIPTLILALLVAALIRRKNAYELFSRGAAGAPKLVLAVLPALTAMLVAVGALRASGLGDWLAELLRPALETVGIGPELAPMFFLRPLTGSGALAMLRDILSRCGVDSDIGRAAATMMGSTETIFYTMSVYLGAAGIKNSRYAVPAALLSGAAGMTAAVWLTRIL